MEINTLDLVLFRNWDSDHKFFLSILLLDTGLQLFEVEPDVSIFIYIHIFLVDLWGVEPQT